MRRFFLFVMILVFTALSLRSFAQRPVKSQENDQPSPPSSEDQRPGPPDRMGGPMGQIGEIFKQSKNEDGDVNIEKAAEALSSKFQAEIAKADANNDGLVDAEELKSARLFARPDFANPPRNEGHSSRGDRPRRENQRRPSRNSRDGDQTAPPQAGREGPSDSEMGPPPGADDAESSEFGDNAQRQRPRRPMRDPLANAKTDDGKIDLSKLPERMPEEFREALTHADSDGDGFLGKEEQASLPFVNQHPDVAVSRERPPSRSRGSREERPLPPEGAPGTAHVPFGPIGVVFNSIEQSKNEEGSIVVHKLEESIRTAQVDFLKKADTDNNGVLSEEELTKILPPRPRPEGRPFGEGKAPVQNPEK